MPTIHLEAPYMQAEAREARYQQIKDQCQAEILESLGDEQVAEEYIETLLKNPKAALANIWAECVTRHAVVSKLRLEREKAPEGGEAEFNSKIRANLHLFFDKVLSSVVEQAEIAAEGRAQRIYEEEDI